MLTESQIRQKTADIVNGKDFLDIFGVRITPPFLAFRQAFEGKTYKLKLSIQNTGKSKVVVRITQPSSYAYHVKPVRAHNLSPGLTLVKEISFVSSYLISPSSFLPIYINGNRHDYQLYTTTVSPDVIVSPKCIDFGAIDTGYPSPPHTLVLKNDGNAPTRFYIDAPAMNEYTVIVEPIKGLLQAQASIVITIQLLTNNERKIVTELWVKTNKPEMVLLKAESINARFEPIMSGLPSTFKLLDFPTTYEGLTSTQTVYIRNFSASATMFCMLGEINQEIMTLEACRKLQTDYNFFSVLPNFGMFDSKAIKAIDFKFQPGKPKPDHKDMCFYFCTFHICRVRSKYLTKEDYRELFTDDSAADNDVSICDSVSSRLTRKYSELDYLILRKSYRAEYQHIVRPPEQCNCAKFHLHGISETPRVTVVPDELSLTDLAMGRRETRVLELQNKSFNLPIIVVYRKSAYIDLDKFEIYIKPYSSVQVSVYITPQKLGKMSSQIQFDLVFYDYPKVGTGYKVIGKLAVPVKFTVKPETKTPLPQINTGITPNYIKEVGKFCQNLKFDKKVQKPKAAIFGDHLMSKSSSALIALPNDTQKSLRPWRNKDKCKTIFTKICRYVPPIDSDYELTVFDQEVKIKADNYYMNYIRQKAKRLQLAVDSTKAVNEDDIAGRRKYLCMDFKLPSPQLATTHQRLSTTEYLPLLINPEQIVNVIVDPKVVNTGSMGASHKYEFVINIKNKNNMTISIIIKPDKFNVLFPEGNRKLVKGNSEIVFPAIYISPAAIGFHSVELKLVLNDVAYIIVDVIADVCPPNLNLSKNLIEFAEETTYDYVEISNPLCTRVNFKWNLFCHNFEIHPQEGACKASSSLLCYVRYFPNRDGPLQIDAELTSAGKSINQLRIVAQAANKKLYFVPHHLTFKDTPLNIPVVQKVMLKNESAVLQHYSLIPSEFDKFVEIFPRDGIVYPTSSAVITVTLKLKACVSFDIKLSFHITRSQVTELVLSGNVAYPEVVIRPDSFNFNKIPCSTTDTLRFTVENKSNAVVSIKFDMSMYSEYAITSTNKMHNTETVEKITLEKRARQTLYAHFKPYAACRDKFFLPIIINDMIGPVINETESKSVTRFLTEEIPQSKVIPLPPTIELISVRSYATEAKIIFSKFTVNLTYARSLKRYESTYRLKIINPQSVCEKICIRTDNLKHPLYLTLISGKEIIQLDKAIVCSLEPQEEIYFEVSFRPDTVGTYKAALPIFLRSDNSEKPHNIFCIEGVFPVPTIWYHRPIYYSKAVPLKISVVNSAKLIFKHHFDDCQVHSTGPIPWLELEVLDTIHIGRDEREVLVTGRFRPEVRGSVFMIVSIYCSCGGRSDIPVYFTIDNCFLTNYAFVHNFILHPDYNLELKKVPSMDALVTLEYISCLHKDRNVTFQNRCSLLSIMDAPKVKLDEYDLSHFLLSYPLFPDEHDPMYKFMESCVSVMETWIYTQAFFGNSFYKIPDDIVHIHFINSDNYKSKPTVLLPFIKLLTNLLGEKMDEYFQLEIPVKCSSADLEVAYLIFHLYKKAIDFLESEGADFICVTPEYLMPFETYTLFMQNLSKDLSTHPVLTVTDFEEFYRLTKQVWLELLMQTYRVLVLSKVIRPLEKYHPSLHDERTPHTRYRHSIKNISTNSHLFSTTELLLLNWLTFHYKDVRKTYWANYFCLEDKEMSYFGENMDDGFIYAAITLTYCPYFDEHFKKLCPRPGTSEELLHNNVNVMQSWDILNLNTGITVADLLDPHPLRTLVTIIYLHEVLPHMFPAETLEFKTGLSLRTGKKLTITNNNNFPVAYKAVLYGNEDECFAIGKPFYVIQPNSKCAIGVNYWAKFVKSSRCTLILSGECRGYRYARSKVVSLSGVPDLSYVTAEYNLTAELYKMRESKVSIIAPYALATVYNVQYTNTACSNAEDVENAPYRRDLPTFCVTRCLPMDLEFECNEEGKGEMVICSLPLTTRTISTWIFFRNSEVGDFSIKVKTKVTALLRQEILEVEVPPWFGDKKILYRTEQEILLEIPCQNHILWNGIIKMLKKIAETDIEFWKDVIHTTAGMHALQRLISFSSVPDSGELRIREPSDFSVAKEKRCKVVLPDLVHIDDKCHTGYVKVPLRFADKNNPQNFSIVLKSTNDLEIRQYRVYFVKTSESDLLSSD